MNCKDCIHYEVCLMYDSPVNSENKANEQGAENCKRFKDKSKFIELPCEVGDKYFTINITCSCGGYETKGEYLPHDSDCDGCCENCDKEYIIKEHIFNTVLDILQKKNGLGWYYFLTYEEAEAKLEEAEAKLKELEK